MKRFLSSYSVAFALILNSKEDKLKPSINTKANFIIKNLDN